jgi:hypothetical protein
MNMGACVRPFCIVHRDISGDEASITKSGKPTVNTDTSIRTHNMSCFFVRVLQFDCLISSECSTLGLVFLTISDLCL